MEKVFLNELEKQQIRRETFHTGFLKQVLLVSCSLLGIVGSIGYYSSNVGRVLYLCMLVLNLLGILCVGVVLFVQVRGSILLEKQTKEYIKATMGGQRPDEIPFVPTVPYAFWIEYFGYGMLICAMVLLVVSRFFE